jgi:hypothetical protein
MDGIRGHELHGARQVGQWPADELVDLWGRACSGVVKHTPRLEVVHVSGFPLVTPAPIPELRHHRVEVRFAF